MTYDLDLFLPLYVDVICLLLTPHRKIHEDVAMDPLVKIHDDALYS